jgi:hypothetical protein
MDLSPPRSLNWKPILLSFVIGSSLPTFILYFIAVRFFIKNKRYLFEDYCFIAPAFLGTANAVCTAVAQQYGLSLETRLLGASVVLPAAVFAFVMTRNLYNYGNRALDILTHAAALLLIYGLVFNGIVYSLEKQFA